MHIGSEVRWDTCFEGVGEAGSHICTLDALIDSRYVVLNLLDKMRALRAEFDEYFFRCIKEAIMNQNGHLPEWQTQVETLPANRTLRFILLAKCSGLAAISNANNKLQEWIDGPTVAPKNDSPKGSQK